MKVYNKQDSLLMKIINMILLIITFGKQKYFMTRYVTTIGEKIYVPSDWNETSAQDKDVILVHENVHVKQYRKEKFLFYFKYLFWPLPVLHAHARLDYEIEAYATDIVYSCKKYGTPALTGDRFNNVVEQLSGPMYFWTCTNKGYVARLLTDKILSELKRVKYDDLRNSE